MTSNIGSTLIQDAFQDVSEANLEDVVDKTKLK
jgi:hypothetical protein